MSPNEDAVLQTLVVRVEEMRDAFTSLESRLMERCPAHERAIAKMEVIIHGPPGNGRHPGLLSRMDKMEDALGRIDRMRSWIWGLVGTALGGAVVVLLERIFR